MLIHAASSYRTIGLVIALIVLTGFAVYVLFNVFATGTKEIGSEVELAPNRKPYFDDEILETRRLEFVQTVGVGTLFIICLALPLYWLGEPGRHEGRDEFTTEIFIERGQEKYTALCSQCHGAGAVGGQAAYTILDENARYVAAVNWTAPALNTVLYRFSIDEVTHILNYGRPQSPMPAWGAPGGGPLTTQQLEEIIEYLKSIQLTPEEITADVQAGLRNEVIARVRADHAEAGTKLNDATAVLNDAAATTADKAAAEKDRAAATQELTDAFDALIDGLGAAVLGNDRDATASLLDTYLVGLAADNLEAYGELLFNNRGGAGGYGCARCHTAGFSWGADELLAANPALEGLVEPEIPGGGGFGPSLRGVEAQFVSAASQEAFISAGCSPNLQYGNNGVCEPSGQMPGFGDESTDLDGGLLTPEQIAAIVQYERGLE